MLMNTLRNQVKWIMAAIVVIFVLSIFLMYGPGGGGKGDGSRDYAVAEVDGKKIMRSQIEAGMAQMAEQSQATESARKTSRSCARASSTASSSKRR